MSTSRVASMFDQLREAVHYKWDPIGAMDYNNEMGEYDSYMPALHSFLKRKPGREEIFKYIWDIETCSMGLEGDRVATEKFSVWLLDFSRKFV